MRRLSLLGALLLSACGTPPRAPAPKVVDSGVLAISVRTLQAKQTRQVHARVVTFVRLAEGVDPLRGRDVIRSNHHFKGVCYLLDAEPGRYAAVACEEERDGRTLHTTFPTGLVRQTVVTVPAGRFASMGRWELEVVGIGATADEAQKHFRPLVEPDWEAQTFAVSLFARSRYFLGRAFRRHRDRMGLTARASSHLSESGWSDRFLE